MLALLRAAAGLMLVSAGMLGMILPIIPGIPFLLAGLFLLGPDHPLSRRVRGHRLVRPVFERLQRWRNKWRNRGQAASSQDSSKEAS
jgi:uncharacterized membrane protein YbaN (DUF454 family)